MPRRSFSLVSSPVTLRCTVRNRQRRIHIKRIKNSLKRVCAVQSSKVKDELLGYRHSRRIALVLIVASLTLSGIIIFLSIDLPDTYRATNWSLAWAGFDVLLLLTILLTLWALFNRKQIAVIASSMSGTILIIDTWFDITTSQPGRDFYVALLTGLFLGIPFALTLFWFSKKLLDQLANKE